MKLNDWTLARHLGFESAMFELDHNNILTKNPYMYDKQRIAYKLWWEGFKEGWIVYPSLQRSISR